MENDRYKSKVTWMSIIYISVSYQLLVFIVNLGINESFMKN